MPEYRIPGYGARTPSGAPIGYREDGHDRFRGVTKRFDDGTVAVDALDLLTGEGQITVLATWPRTSSRECVTVP